MEECGQPFSIADLALEIRQGRPKSAPGNDKITWKHIRNLPKPGVGKLLEHTSISWVSGLAPEHLKLTLVFPMPKPRKAWGYNTKLSNLRPIFLPYFVCNLTERLINTRIIPYTEYVQPFLHPGQTSFRPILGTIDNLRLLRGVINRLHKNRSPPDSVLVIDLCKGFGWVSQSIILEEVAATFLSTPSNREEV